MKKIITLESGVEMLICSGLRFARRLALQKKMLLTGIHLTNVLRASFSQKSSDLLSLYESPFQPSGTDTFGQENFLY